MTSSLEKYQHIYILEKFVTKLIIIKFFIIIYFDFDYNFGYDRI